MVLWQTWWAGIYRVEYCLGGNYIRRNFLDCNNPGGNFPGGSYPGCRFYLVGVFRVDVVRGQSSGWQFFSSTSKIAKNQKFGLITYIISRYFKNLIFSKTRMVQSVKSNSFEKFKAIAALPILRPYFRMFFLRFLRKSSKFGYGNLVLITSTVQVELSKLNFNFGDVRANFIQVLTCYGFSRLLCYDGARQN